MPSREHPIAVTADMLAGGRPLHARWRTPVRYGIAEHPRDGTPLLIVSEAVPRGETSALWVGYLLTPPHDGQPVEWAPLGCFVVDEDAWAAMMEPHLPAIRAEAERRVREADAEYRRQKARDLSALLRGDDVTPAPMPTPTANRGAMPADPIPADLLERARAYLRSLPPTDGRSSYSEFPACVESLARILAAERDTARAEIERLTREVEEGRLTLLNERGLGPTPEGEWEWDGDGEWRCVEGAASEDEEPINLYVRDRRVWYEEGTPAKPWGWHVAPQIGMGDEGPDVAFGEEATAREAMEAANKALEVHCAESK
jgi:hypothetical protein